jgi:hypothetical protein
MAHITVLWLLALLTMLATTLVGLSVNQQRVAERYSQAVRTDEIADSAIRVTLLGLINTHNARVLVTLGVPHTIDVLDSNVLVTIEREAGRIDLNTADPDLLLALFAANGWREDEAHALADSIVASRGDPFLSVAEVQRISGAARFDAQVLDSLTVFTRSPGCSESAAAAPVKRALAWADEHHLGGHGWLSSNTGTTSFPAAAASSSFSGEVVRVSACMDVSGFSRCRTAVTRLTGNMQKPIQVFVWQSNFKPTHNSQAATAMAFEQ